MRSHGCGYNHFNVTSHCQINKVPAKEVLVTPHPLIAADDSVLILIDVQPPFLEKLLPADAGPLAQRISWLIGVARWLEIPLIVTAEDIQRSGSVHPQIAQSLPPDTVIYDKMTFNLAGDPAILAAVASTQRTTAILVGLETDVCVAQSALGLLENGYRVAVVADATGSPGSAHAYGLDRIRQAGGTIVSVKGLYYEWIRTVERTYQFWQECGQLIGAPEGIPL
jgi:nicotinamidase-related amidase